ncbi:short-chain dehydrogenase [Hyaloraphidium curvatum]|nr:short-chain dehydrogenase [Hyaloraphidium curvatum]
MPDASAAEGPSNAFPDFKGRFAVVSGGGYGMGRHLVLRLASAGCDVAFSDVNKGHIDETLKLAASTGSKVTGHVADAGKEEDWKRFRAEALEQHGRNDVNLLFNNAGIGGGGSFVVGDRAEWEKVFNVDFFGVYYGCRTFVDDLIKADKAHLINTASVNGFFASIGPHIPHTSYSAAKFAVKGFTEALIADLQIHAPHVGVSVVCPGWIGTGIGSNSALILGRDPVPNRAADDRSFEDGAPTSAAEAAKIILDGVRAGEWRILVGKDAEELDRMVRERPKEAYGLPFWKDLQAKGHLTVFGSP